MVERDRSFWINFGRGAVPRSQYPAPAEVSDLILKQQDEIEALKSNIETERKRFAGLLSDLQAPLTRCINEIEEKASVARAAFKRSYGT